MMGAAVHLAGCLIAAMTAAAGIHPPGERVQRRVKAVLSFVSVLLAGALAYAGWSGLARPAWQAALLVLGALLLGNALGLLCRVQAGSNAAGRWGAQGLAAESSPTRFLLGLAVVLGLNPLGWLAGFWAGLTGDIRLLAFKALVDGLGVWSVARSRPASAALGAALVGVSHSVWWLGGDALRGASGLKDLTSLAGLSAALFLLVLPLVLLGLARVPLARLALSVPLVLLLSRVWS